MEFEVIKASSMFGEPHFIKEVNTIEDLKAIQKSEGHPLVIDFESNEITIYDDHIE